MPIIEHNGQVFHLSHEEREKLDEFRVITDFPQDDLPLIIRLLQNYGWHLERALSFYFDGDWKSSIIAQELPAIPNRPPTPATFPPIPERSPFIASDAHLIPSLRVVKPLPSNFREVFSVVGLNKNNGDVWNMNPQHSPLIIILMFIPRLLVKLGVSVLSLLWGLITFGFNSHLDERTNVRKVPSRPKEKQPPFDQLISPLIDGQGLERLNKLMSTQSFNEAFKICQDEFKYLLIVFIGDVSDEEDPDVNSQRFISKVLSNPTVLSMLESYKDELIIYLGSVHELETWLVAQDLRIKYVPECLLVGNVLNSKGSVNGVTRLSVLSKLRISSAKKFENSLKVTIEKFQPELVVSRTEQAEILLAREIKKLQDDAYQNSLEQDRVKAEERKMKEEEALLELNNKTQREKDKKIKETVKHLQWLRSCADFMKKEPATSGVGTVATLQIRTSKGLRLVKEFSSTTSLHSLYVKIGCHLYLDTNSKDQEELSKIIADKLQSLAEDDSVLCFKDREVLKDELKAENLTKAIELELKKWKDEMSSDLEFDFELVSPFPREKIPVDKEMTVKEVTQLWPKGSLLVEELVEDDEDDEDDDEDDEDEESMESGSE